MTRDPASPAEPSPEERSEPPAPRPGTGTAGRTFPRPLLWTLLVVSLTANGITSISPLPVGVGIAFGVLSLVLAALLIRDHYRRRSHAAPEGAGPTSPQRPGA
jgi:hypothetical protein